jgi:hypothetical protein
MIVARRECWIDKARTDSAVGANPPGWLAEYCRSAFVLQRLGEQAFSKFLSPKPGPASPIRYAREKRSFQY